MSKVGCARSIQHFRARECAGQRTLAAGGMPLASNFIDGMQTDKSDKGRGRIHGVT